MEKQDLVRLLLDSSTSIVDSDETTERLIKLLLRVGSETPDNIEAVQYIEFGDSFENGDLANTTVVTQGLKVRQKNLPLSEIVYCIEGIEMPNLLKERYPDLTQEEFDAALRVIILMLISLEYRNSHNDG